MPLAASAIAAVTAAGSLLAMCQPVPPSPGPDTTSPTVVLDVHGIPGSSFLTVPAGGATRTVPRATRLDLIASGTDAESGIDFVMIEGEIAKSCDSPDGETATLRRATIRQRIPTGPSPGATVTTRIVTLSIDLGFLPCSRPTGLSGTLRASTTNEVGLRASTGSFHFSYQL